MITTLTSRLLADTTLTYSLSDGKLVINIATAANHNLIGDVNVVLANVKVLSIYTDSVTKVDDFFNSNFTFTVTGLKTLEYKQKVLNGLTPSATLITLPDNGGAITATVDNLSFTFPQGKYLTRLINDASSVFDGALISLQEQDIVTIGGVTKFNGISDVYSEFNEDILGVTYSSIDNQELTFNNYSVISATGAGALTNIPIIFTPR